MSYSGTLSPKGEGERLSIKDYLPESKNVYGELRNRSE